MSPPMMQRCNNTEHTHTHTHTHNITNYNVKYKVQEIQYYPMPEKKFPRYLTFSPVFRNFNAQHSNDVLGKPTVLPKVGWETLIQTLSASLNKLQNKIQGAAEITPTF